MIKLKGYVIAALVLFVTLGQLASAGHIYSWDIDIDKQTVGYARKFRLFFSLESGLSKDGFLYIVSPLSWGTNNLVRATLYPMGVARVNIGNILLLSLWSSMNSRKKLLSYFSFLLKREIRINCILSFSYFFFLIFLF